MVIETGSFFYILEFMKEIFTSEEIQVKSAYLGELELYTSGKSDAEVRNIIEFLKSAAEKLGIRDAEYSYKDFRTNVILFYYTGTFRYGSEIRTVSVQLRRWEDKQGLEISVQFRPGSAAPSDPEQLLKHIGNAFTSEELAVENHRLGKLELTASGTGKERKEQIRTICENALKSLDVNDIEYYDPNAPGPGGTITNHEGSPLVSSCEGTYIYDYEPRVISVDINRLEGGGMKIDVSYEAGAPTLRRNYVEELFTNDFLKMEPASGMDEHDRLYLTCDRVYYRCAMAFIEEGFYTLGVKSLGKPSAELKGAEQLVYGPYDRSINNLYNFDEEVCRFIISY